MTVQEAVERAARAANDHGAHSFVTTGEIRAALRAFLTACPVTEEMGEAGADAYFEAREAGIEENRKRRNDSNFSGVAPCQYLPQTFRAMLAALAKEIG